MLILIHAYFLITLADDPERPRREAAIKANENLRKLSKKKKGGPAPAPADTPPVAPAFPTPSTSGGQRGGGLFRSIHDALLGQRDDQQQSDDEDDDEASVNASEGDDFSTASDADDNQLPGTARTPPVMATNFEDDNSEDLKDAQIEARQIKLDFDRKDVKAWLTRFEIRLDFAGVKSQWLKRLCLENILPQDIANSCKDYFCLPKASAGADIYKLCKLRILEKYGPKPEEDYKKAISIVLTGLPSEAAKDIRDLICEKTKPLESCCCAKAVGAIWRDLLPPTVKAAVAGMDLKTDFANTVKKADQVYNAVKVAQPVALVAPSKPPKASASAAAASLDTSADAPALDQVANLAEQIAAFNKNFNKHKKQQRGGGRGAQGTRGGGRGQAGAPQSRGRGKPHPDGPPDDACLNHWRHGRSAYYCLEPSKCSWSHITNPPK